MEKHNVKELVFQAYNLSTEDPGVRSTESLNKWFEEIYNENINESELLKALIELTECDYTSETHLSCAIARAKQAIKKVTQ